MYLVMVLVYTEFTNKMVRNLCFFILTAGDAGICTGHECMQLQSGQKHPQV
jgi:hypothetical protein